MCVFKSSKYAHDYTKASRERLSYLNNWKIGAREIAKLIMEELYRQGEKEV